jgi:hypothetical protein
VTVEVPGPIPLETQQLEAILLATLSENDGLCLDNEEERQQLAATLARALVAAARNGDKHEAPSSKVEQAPKRGRWPEPTTERPEFETLEEWHSDGGCEATDGCWVEPDGVCQHGHPSWLLRLGYI